MSYDSIFLLTQDCAISCPKDPETQEEPSCQASKCCPPTTTTASTSKSTQNTPLTDRRGANAEFGNQGVRTGEPNFYYAYLAWRSTMMCICTEITYANMSGITVGFLVPQ